MTGDIVPYLSAPRVATYKLACNGDREKALELYRANARISGYAYTSLHYFEVILRNAIDRELRAWNFTSHGTDSWATDAAPLLLSVIGLDRLQDARHDASRAVGKRRAVVHDDVVAQLSLGTWRYLLPSQRHQGKQKLWEDALELAFPNRHGVRPDQIAASVSIVYDFRNRVAHHEPIFALDLQGKRRAMRDVMNAVGADARKWFVSHEPLSGALTDFYRDWPSFKRMN